MRISDWRSDVCSSDLGADVTNHAFETAYEEAMWVVDQIAEDIAAGCPREEIAVLVRASHALNFVEQALNQQGIRYTLSGGKKFQDRAEIKDISAYLRLIANAHRSEEHTSVLQSLMRHSHA